MICQEHEYKILALCTCCKNLICIQCIFESDQNHLNHMQNIIFIQNIILLVDGINLFLSRVERKLHQFPKIMRFVSEQKEIYSQLFEELKHDQSFYQTQLLIDVIEKKPVYFIGILIRQIPELQEFQKIKIHNQLKTARSTINIKFQQHNLYDLYYLLRNYGKNDYALFMQKKCLKELIKQNVFFKIQDGQNQEIKQYQQIEQDEHFNLSLGRNYFLLHEHEKCIEFLNDFPQSEEAKKYIALSNLCLGEFQIAYLQFSYLQHINQELLLFIQCCHLGFYEFLENAIAKLETIHKEYQRSILFNIICFRLYEFEKIQQLLTFCCKTIEKEHNNYYALLYQGIIKVRRQYQENNYDKLISLQPQNVFGYVLKGVCLLNENRFQETNELCKSLEIRFKGKEIFIFLKCINLFLQEQYSQSMVLLNQLIQQTFLTPDQIFSLKLLLLLKQKNLPEIYELILSQSNYSESFYTMIDYFFVEINLMSLHESAINLLLGYIIEEQSDSNIFYNAILGKLLINFGVNFRNSEIIQQGLDKLIIYATSEKNDQAFLPYVQYYIGRALLTLKRLDESNEWFEKSCGTQRRPPKKEFFKEYLFINKFIQGKFEEIEPNSQSELFNGLLLWAQGQNDQSLQLISQYTDNFPILRLVISWIYQEQNKKEEAENILSHLQQTYPNLQLFCQRYVFLSLGPYSQYIKDNQNKYDMLDSKKYYAIKILAFYLEIQGLDFCIDELFAPVEKNILIFQELLSGLNKAIILQTCIERKQIIANIILI